jgi:four helix bundle protein
LTDERPHKKLKLWKASMDLVVSIYEVTRGFPREEEFGLKSQLRRAAVSAPSNIAEGLTRASKADKKHFLNIAQSSLSEIDAQLEISERLGFIDGQAMRMAETQMKDVYMLLSGLQRSIK